MKPAKQKSLIDLVKWYGAWGSMRLCFDVVATRLCFPRARLIRRPAYIRGARWIEIQPGFTTGPGVRLDAIPLRKDGPPVIVIGRDVQVNDYVHIAAVSSVVIGDRVLIASKVFISDHNHGCYSGLEEQSHPAQPPLERTLHVRPVRIEEDVWIGEGVSVLPGVTIGKGAVVGAASVVTRNVPAYAIAVGSPARVVKQFNFNTKRWDAL